MNNTKVKRCGNLNEVVTALNEKVIYTNLKYVLVHVGVNDTDENSGSAVFNMIDELTRKMWEKYPDLKIILSEITPRKDVKDLEVKLCKRLLHERAQHTPELHIARHSNLRHPNGYFLRDAKHIKSSCIARFAANLKIALRKAYGLERNRYRDRNDYHQQNAWQRESNYSAHHQALSRKNDFW